MKLKDACSWKKSYDKPRLSILKSRDITLQTNVNIFKAMVFPVVMYGCVSWTIKKAECWRIDAFKLVLEKTLECPMDSKEIKPVSPKGNQSWIFIGRTDAETEAPVLWPPDGKSLFIWKDPDARKDWGREEKGVMEDEMVEWHHSLSGHEFEQTLGNSEGQRSLVCCSSWGHNELDTSERMNNNNKDKLDSFWEQFP